MILGPRFGSTFLAYRGGGGENSQDKGYGRGGDGSSGNGQYRGEGGGGDMNEQGFSIQGGCSDDSNSCPDRACLSETFLGGLLFFCSGPGGGYVNKVDSYQAGSVFGRNGGYSQLCPIFGVGGGAASAISDGPTAQCDDFGVNGSYTSGERSGIVTGGNGRNGYLSYVFYS